MEKKILKYIIIVIVLIIITAITFIIVNILNEKRRDEKLEEELELKSDLETIEIYEFSEYASMNNYIDTYFGYISSKDAELVLSVLNEEYVQNKKLTEKNILDNILEVKNNQKYTSQKIIELETSLTVKNYFVYGYITNDDTQEKGKKEECNFVVNIDYENNTFSIAPYGEVYKDSIVYNDDSIEVKASINEEEMSKEIEKRVTNAIKRVDMNSDDIADYYLNLYIEDTKYYPEDAYNYLDKEYRDKRFGNINKFKEYLSSRERQLRSAHLNKYSADQEQGFTQYICVDNYGNYYIFNQTRPMDFDLMLDYYTVDVEKFTSQYNNGNDMQKVAMNVDKFVNMINAKDYEAAYSKLDETFRNNNFGSEESFKEYSEKTFYEINKVETVNAEEQGSVYVIEVNLYNYATYIPNNESQSKITKTFIVKLGDSNDFTLSFNVE